MNKDFDIEVSLQMEAVEQLQDENNRLKWMLVKVLEAETSMDAVQWLDVFHTTVLDIDAMLALLRYDIARLSGYAHEIAADDRVAETMVEERHRSVAEEIKVIKGNVEALALLLENQIQELCSAHKIATINSPSAAASFPPGSKYPSHSSRSGPRP